MLNRIATTSVLLVVGLGTGWVNADSITPTTKPTTQPVADKWEQLYRNAQPSPGPVGRYQIVAGRMKGIDTVFRVDTQTGQVWYHYQAAANGQIVSGWCSMPNTAIPGEYLEFLAEERLKTPLKP